MLNSILFVLRAFCLSCGHSCLIIRCLLRKKYIFEYINPIPVNCRIENYTFERSIRWWILPITIYVQYQNEIVLFLKRGPLTDEWNRILDNQWKNRIINSPFPILNLILSKSPVFHAIGNFWPRSKLFLF